LTEVKAALQSEAWVLDCFRTTFCGSHSHLV